MRVLPADEARSAYEGGFDEYGGSVLVKGWTRRVVSGGGVKAYYLMLAGLSQSAALP